MCPTPESRTVAKLAWEAAWERLGNALRPPPGYPEPTPEQLAECYRIAQERLNDIGIAYDLVKQAEPRPAPPGQA